MSEQVTLGTEVLDVRTAHPAAGEHQRGMDKDLAPVVKRGPFTQNGDVCREVFTEPQSVGEVPKSMEADVSDHLVATGCHNYGERAGSFRLVGALLSGELVRLQTPVSPARRAGTRIRADQVKRSRE